MLVIGRVVIVGGVAPGGMAGATWPANQARWAASDSQSSVTWNPPSVGPAAWAMNPSVACNRGNSAAVNCS